MSQATRRKAYTYNFKTILARSYGFGCGNQALLELFPPEDLLEIKNIWTHFVLQFDSAVPLELQVLPRIALTDGFLNDTNLESDSVFYYDLNLAADANRIIDYQLDLSVGLHPTLRNYPGVVLQFPEEPIGTNEFGHPISVNGIIEAWKIDILYTTQEIR